MDTYVTLKGENLVSPISTMLHLHNHRSLYFNVSNDWFSWWSLVEIGI